MNTLVLGSTGLIGYNIVKILLNRGRNIRVLVRSPEKARSILGSMTAGCEIVPGDITDTASLESAMKGCETVYHAAGMPEQWLPDNDMFRRVNTEGTRNVIEAARSSGVKRLIYTSTIDVFQASRGQEYDERTIDPQPKGTYYERSKQEADSIAARAQKSGMDIVFLHPSGVYGPGPLGTPGTNQFIADLCLKKIPLLLPGGFPVVYSEDVAEGHVLADEKAKSGDRFILSGSYHSLSDMAQIVAQLAGLKKIPSVMPLWMGTIISVAGEALSSVIRRPPLLPKGQLHFLQWQAVPKSDRARKVLGWKSIPTKEGIQETLAFLKEKGLI